MKKFKTYLAWFAAAIGMTGVLTACQDDIDAPSPNAPVATNEANTTIFDLKKAFWQDETNYIAGMENVEDAPKTPIGVKEDGSHYIIKGVVVSSDEASNVFKSLVIQDKTAAIALSINSYNLYLNYRMGQEVVLDVTGMFIGKYNGLLQIGYPEWYSNGNCWEASFMAPEVARKHIELNGWPSAAAIDTLEINSFSDIPSNPDGLMRYQSRLVKFNDVHFDNGGKETFSTYHSSGVNQSIIDNDGNSLPVRTSGYSNFWNKTLPTGQGDVVCILSYYGTTGWQLILNDYQGCMDFGSERPARPGTEENPWTVDQAVENEVADKAAAGWVYGYIVGAVAPEVETVTSNSDIEWTSTPVLDNTLVIGQTADTKDLAHALVIELPYGSKLQELGNLVAHPENYGKRIDIKGTLAKVLGTYGVTDNTGAAGTWKIEGVEVGGGDIPNGDGTKEKPYSPGQVLGGAASGTSWVKGYIVGWVDGMNLSEGAKFEVPATSMSNLLIAANPDVKDASQCVPVQLPFGDVRTALNLQNNPGNLGKAVSLYGSIEKYFGVSGVKAVTEYVLEGSDTPNPPTPPAEVVTSLDEGFSGGAIPNGWTQVQVAGNKTWYTPSFQDNYYAAMTGYKGTAPFDQWLFTPGVDLSKCDSKVLTFDTQVNGYGSTTSVLEVYVLSEAQPTASVKTKLSPTLATAPASGYSEWVASGSLDLSSYSGVVYIGFRYYATQDANYATWCVDNVKLNAGGETPTPPTPPTPTPGDSKGDFNSFNGGAPKASPYGTYTNATGWTAENCIILSGDDDATKASNPYFGFIGKAGVLAPTLNGKAGAAGKLTSPLLTGGCGTLTFNYGFAFTEAKCSFTVTVKDANGNVVKTDTVELTSIEKLKSYDYSLPVNVSGNFYIEIVNNSLSGATSNKDRVSIWNLTWTE
ncbi:MAG: DUF6359 domain-containing protein [Bacteroidales bacterium]|nr:DUF6359 domain-containing protein [Bacteroidales bacterium]